MDTNLYPAKLQAGTAQSAYNHTWHYTDGQLLENFVGESVLFWEEVDFGSELPLEAVEHCVFDHEVTQLAVG